MNLAFTDTDSFNDKVTHWATESHTQLKDRLTALGVKRYSYSQNPRPLKQALRKKLRKKYDLINRISYKMPRSAVFLAKGVSKGHPISNPRKAKDWFNTVIDSRINELVEIVADETGNMIINAINIK